MMARIQAFNEAMGGGVLIVKQSKGYCLLRNDNGVPIARLRPTGKDDLVAVMRRSYRHTWEHIGECGPMVMPLDEALKYVAKDPMGVFWK